MSGAQVYKASNQTKYFWIEHWKALLDTAQLLGAHALMPAEARLIFAASQASMRDELKRRQRAVSLVLFDFFEVCTIVGALLCGSWTVNCTARPPLYCRANEVLSPAMFRCVPEHAEVGINTTWLM
jgi:hypothetical protein